MPVRSSTGTASALLGAESESQQEGVAVDIPVDSLGQFQHLPLTREHLWPEGVVCGAGREHLGETPAERNGSWWVEPSVPHSRVSDLGQH